MAKTKKHKKITTASKRIAGKTKATSIVKAAKGVRAQASRRTAQGKFTKVVFNQIGGKDCRRFAAMTWKERDAIMAKAENAAVRDRYAAHLASVESKT